MLQFQGTHPDRENKINKIKETIKIIEIKKHPNYRMLFQLTNSNNCLN